MTETESGATESGEEVQQPGLARRLAAWLAALLIRAVGQPDTRLGWLGYGVEDTLVPELVLAREPSPWEDLLASLRPPLLIQRGD